MIKRETEEIKPWKQDAGCTGKQPHSRAMATKIVKRYPEAMTYRCQFCDHWHIGRKSHKSSRRMKCV